MIESVEINNFRGICHGRIDTLSQVNLFFGKNNCGKSSLLESLFLVCGQSNPLLPSSINAMRTYAGLKENDIHYFFYNTDVTNEIRVATSGSDNRHLTISAFRETLPIDDGNASTDLPYRYGLRMKYGIGNGEYSSEVRYGVGGDNKVREKIQLDSRYVESLKCVYLSPRYDSKAFLEGLQNIIRNKDEEFLTDALRILEPKAQSPVFIENVMYVDTGLPRRIPINLMGDGIRKVVSILTSIYQCRGGVVLVDELSNGFHYSVMKDMWKMVIRSAVKNDVQIFATTHDQDSIRGFQQASVELKEEIGRDRASGFKLQRLRGDELKGYRFSVDQLEYALNQEIEIR